VRWVTVNPLTDIPLFIFNLPTKRRDTVDRGTVTRFPEFVLRSQWIETVANLLPVRNSKDWKILIESEIQVESRETVYGPPSFYRQKPLKEGGVVVTRFSGEIFKKSWEKGLRRRFENIDNKMGDAVPKRGAVTRFPQKMVYGVASEWRPLFY